MARGMKEHPSLKDRDYKPGQAAAQAATGGAASSLSASSLQLWCSADFGSSLRTSSNGSSKQGQERSSSSRFFLDEYGRRVIPRGVCLGANSKLPKGTHASHVPLGRKMASSVSPSERSGMENGAANGEAAAAAAATAREREGDADMEDVSYVGRPLDLDRADEHLARLRHLGLTLLRLVVPWEALEHAGPGEIDEAYLAYVRALADKCAAHGCALFIDAHQDVWSRHAGGSGAPLWTLNVAGFETSPRSSSSEDVAAGSGVLATWGEGMRKTKAAYVHEHNHGQEGDQGAETWPSGYMKCAPATCATLFWAGETFAPRRRVTVRDTYKGGEEAWKGRRPDREGKVSTQEFMQECYVQAYGRLADTLRGHPAVIGFEVMNEPHRGYISLHSPFSWDFLTDLALAYFPSPLQSWALADGHATTVDHYVRAFPVTRRDKRVLVDPKGVRAWKQGTSCPWREHGVWQWDDKSERAVVLRAEYFETDPKTGKPVEWYRDFYWPFCRRFAERIHQAEPSWSIFVGPIPNEFTPRWAPEEQPRQLVYAPHWYDLESLFTKSFGFMSANVQGLARGMPLWQALHFGRAGARKNYGTQMRNVVRAGYSAVGERPVIVGETGLPVDSNKAHGMRTGKWHWQARQADAVMCALESALTAFTWWTYNPDNDDAHGDGWYGENFSFFSQNAARRDAQSSSGDGDARHYEGVRLRDSIERPYAAKIAGVPLQTTYEHKTLAFTLRYASPMTDEADDDDDAIEGEREATCERPPLRHVPPVLSRETEIHLPRRLYAKHAQEGQLRVWLGKGARGAKWRYDVERQTLYVVHENTRAGHEHLVHVWVEGLHEPPHATLLALVIILVVLVCAGVLALGLSHATASSGAHVEL